MTSKLGTYLKLKRPLVPPTGHTDQPNPNSDLNPNFNLAAYVKRPAAPPTASVGLGLAF